MQDLLSICNQFVQIVNGKANMKNGLCSVELERNFPLTIQNHQSRSALPAGITFESLDYEGITLNFSEVVILREELSSFIMSTRKK
ncbi:DUF1259 domain-containing protein [Psychrobacillus sp. FJAT-51614]|uniref:DUF1259 domain-containing protein n=1 Tax=Psychrobacillus mangrovi TaxID=3117745 RepID=A0ABU8F9J2_9BACI